MDIKVTKIFLGSGKGGHLATAVVVFDEVVEIKFGMFESRDGIRISAPSRKVGDKWYNDVYIISQKVREVLEAKILEAYSAESDGNNKTVSRTAGKEMAAQAKQTEESTAAVPESEDIPF